MVGTKLFIYNIIIWLLTSSKLLIQAEEKLNNTQMSFNETQSLKIFPGIKCLLTDDNIILYVKIQDLLQETEVQSPRRKKNSGNLLQRIGYMMMMTPFILQILSLPGAIASVKMSLLKSIMVAKLAIVLMIYNFIKSTQNTEVIVYQKHPYSHHGYHGYIMDNNYPKKDDEDDWFGR